MPADDAGDGRVGGGKTRRAREGNMAAAVPRAAATALLSYTSRALVLPTRRHVVSV